MFPHKYIHITIILHKCEWNYQQDLVQSIVKMRKFHMVERHIHVWRKWKILPKKIENVTPDAKR